MEQQNLDQLRANKRNPRRITPKRLQMLKKTMQEFGDLGGIVRAADGTLIGGHQRIEAFRQEKKAYFVVERRHEKPTAAGTTAEGYVVMHGERFSYRETNWDEKRAMAASLAANRNAGDWDVTNLTSIVNELADSNFDLDLTMFDANELLAYLPDTNDLADDPPEAQEAMAHEAAPQNTQAATGSQSAQPEGTAPAHVKMVQLFFRESDHERFVEMTDALKDIYKKQNLSDTVLEAVKRASISAAVK